MTYVQVDEPLPEGSNSWSTSSPPGQPTKFVAAPHEIGGRVGGLRHTTNQAPHLVNDSVSELHAEAARCSPHSTKP